MEFAAWQAATAAGLDMWKWENGEYPTWFMERTMAWWNMSNVMSAHMEDAKYKHSKKKK